ncbi:hypothetical protein RYX36_003963, partial [Vicia faba]
GCNELATMENIIVVTAVGAATTISTNLLWVVKIKLQQIKNCAEMVQRNNRIVATNAIYEKLLRAGI